MDDRERNHAEGGLCLSTFDFAALLWLKIWLRCEIHNGKLNQFLTVSGCLRTVAPRGVGGGQKRNCCAPGHRGVYAVNIFNV